MKRLALLVFLASALHAQSHRFPPVDLYTGDPTGVACSVANSIVQSTTTGGVYTCLAGVYKSVATGASAGAAGTNTQVQFNNSGVFGGSQATLDAAGNFNTPGVLAGGRVASTSAMVAYGHATAATLRQLTVAEYTPGSNLGGGLFVWISTATTPDGCFNFAASDDPSGTTGVWQRVGAAAMQLTASTCGAVGDTQVFAGTVIIAGSPILTSDPSLALPFTPTLVGKTVAIGGAGTAGATLHSTVLSYQSPTQVTLSANAITSVTSNRAVIGTDDTAALLRMHNLLIAQAAALLQTSAVYGPLIYMTTATLPLPPANSAGQGGDNWSLSGTFGKTILVQATDNVPILRQQSPAGGTTRRWNIADLMFEYATDQPSTNTDAIGISFDPQGNIPGGANGFRINDLWFVNCFRGISISHAEQVAAHDYILWAFEIANIYSGDQMSGATIYVGGFGNAGATRGIFRNVYMQTKGAVEPAFQLFQMDTVSIDSLEFNHGFNTQLQTTGCTEVEITNLRFETITLNFSNAYLVTFGGAKITTVRGVKFKNMTIGVPASTFVYYFHPFQVNLALGDVDAEQDTTSWGGGAAFLVRPDGTTSVFAGSISGTTLTAPAGTLLPFGMALTGTGVKNGTSVLSQITSTTWSVSPSQTVASTTLTGTLIGHVTFGPGMLAGLTSTSSGGTSNTFPYQSGPPAGFGTQYIHFATEFSQPFSLTSVPANTVSSTAISFGASGTGNFTSWPAPCDGYVVRTDATLSLAVTAGSLGFLPTINGNAIPTAASGSVTTGTTTYRTAAPFADYLLNNAGAQRANRFSSGDLIGMKYTTTADFAANGAGQNLIVNVTIMCQ